MREPLTAEQEQIKDEFISIHGGWAEHWEATLRLDPDFMRAYLHMSAVPWKKNNLDAKTKTLVNLAVDAAATHLYVPGVRQHVRAALELDASSNEVMEVLELAATLGIHAMNIGVPILVDVLVEKGLRDRPTPLNDYQERLKAEFMENRGYWHPFWDEMLELDPEMFEAYVAFSSVPWKTGTLTPRVKELIYIAFDCAATHLYVKGLKLHIENAIDNGATAEEILEVMELASALGMHGVATGVPILVEELTRMRQDHDSAQQRR
jgi:alkylhydroperoxidase/carboxymuconolactone decarboxylase family protein YurZ